MKNSLCFLVSIFSAVLMLVEMAGAAATSAPYFVGVAKVDVTPDYPVRLNGFLARSHESEGVAQRIYAKAVAIGQNVKSCSILVSVDNCGVPAHIRDTVLQRLARRGISSDRFAIVSSHTHAAPKLAGNLDIIFATEIPAEHQKHIERYTAELTDKIEKVSLAALKDLKPAHIAFGQTKAFFAMNRRVPGGPVDNDVPVLQITDKKGKTRALILNYACHCTTLGPEFNRISGDWAGYAQEYLEQEFPGATALTLAGCGAECNPNSRNDPEARFKLESAQAHGKELADAVAKLVASGLKPLRQPLACRGTNIALHFDPVPTREEFERRAKLGSTIGYHARVNLQRLDRGEKLPTEQPYFIQVWNFGDELAMVFLAGEVVGDYSLRLKEEFDRPRLWVNGYANDVPCYIPSQRVWKMQGYEAVSSMYVYDKPAPLSPQSEGRILGAVHQLIPPAFLAQPKPLSSAEKEKRHVYLLLGQSNMVGFGKTESSDLTPHVRVWLLNASNRWELAVDPLHGINGRNGVGLGLTFGKQMAALDTNVNIGLVPCAVGGTLLKRWEKGGDLYNNAVARARAAMQTGVLKGILWHQGEQDSILESDANSYHERLAKMIADIRADLNEPKLPFVAGQIGEFLYTRKKQQTPFAQNVNRSLLRIPETVPFTACATAQGLGHMGDEVHFDAKALREFGKRYAEKMKVLLATKTEPAKPAVDLGGLFRMHYENRVRLFKEQNQAWRNVVLLGDSITEGFDIEKYLPGRRVLNRGIGGDVIGNALPKDDPRGVLRRLDHSVFNCAATDVFLLIGINDLNSGRTVDVMEEGYRELLKRVRETAPSIRVHVQSVLPTRDNFAKHNSSVRDFNQRLRKLAEESGCGFIDLHKLMADEKGELRAEFTNDGLHLNEAAYRVWRAEVLKTLGWL